MTDEEFNKDIAEEKDEYRMYLFKDFKRIFWNHLLSIIFKTDAYHAFKIRKDYMLNNVIRAFCVTVELVFCRIKVIINLMAYLVLLVVVERL